ncbi:hypothetical protein MTO96_020264 [Rhipicephalus appendiculatus]
MDRILKGVTQVGCYIDDVIIGGSSIDDRRLKLEEVLTQLRDHKVTLRMEKCKLFCGEVRYLGHGISTEGIRLLGSIEYQDFLHACSIRRTYSPPYHTESNELKGQCKPFRGASASS